MKTGKRILCFLLAAVMTCSMGLAVNSTEAEAATTVSSPNYIRCGVGMKNYTAAYVSMPGKDDNIKNIKVYEGNKTTKNLVVKQTSRTKNTYSGATYGSNATLTLYAKKKGTYKIKFDVYKSKSAKRSSHTITVRARGNSSSALDSVTVDGKKVCDANKNNVNYSYYTTAKSGKVKFALDEGCKITRIEMATYNKKNASAQTKKSFKNGRKATFGKYGYEYSSSSSWNKSMWAPTTFTIYYTDRNDKGQSKSMSYTIYRRAEN